MIESSTSRARFRGIAALIPCASAALALAGCGSAARLNASSGALRATGRVVYYHAAFSAGPTLITREDGRILDERRFEPFGVPIGAIDFALDPHNLLNKETDVATGWSDHGARWLAPETAQWLTPDPPLKAPDPAYMAEPWGLHPYQYVKQNPIVFWDPDGRDDAPTSMLDCRGVCDKNGLVPAQRQPEPPRDEGPSTARKVESFFESIVSPIMTTQAGTWLIAERFAPEAKLLAAPLDKGSTGLSALLAIVHGVQYNLSDSEEERNEHAGGFFLAAASLHPVSGAAIAVLSIIDPDINKHVGTPIRVDDMMDEVKRLNGIEAARKEAVREALDVLAHSED
ncbi:MAG TPA: RHS repeat-associated core domain-containing protein [Kofleriaceae bacterium]|nr:RHS repeat-associated core domain-containing protein [Kofleriaceae bacterium]